MVETSFPPKAPNPFSQVAPVSQERDTISSVSHSPTEGKAAETRPVSQPDGVKICDWPGCGKPCRKPTHAHCSSTCRNRWIRSKNKDSQNDTSPKTSAFNKDFLGQKIRDGASAVAEKFRSINPFAEKPLVAATDVPNPQNPFSVAPAPAVDSAGGILFRKAACAGVKATFSIANAVTTHYAKLAELDDPFIKQLIAKLEPDPDALKDFIESLDAVLKKHNLQPKNAEEWALAINFVRLMTPYGAAIAELRAEIKRKRNE